MDSCTAPSLPHPRFTFCADIGVGASPTVLWTSPANVGIWEQETEECASHAQWLTGSRSLVAFGRGEKKKEEEEERDNNVESKVNGKVREAGRKKEE